VDFTAATEGNFSLPAGDASAASFSEGELTAVGTPLQVAKTISEPKKGGSITLSTAEEWTETAELCRLRPRD
jgi:hypothetical protein